MNTFVKRIAFVLSFFFIFLFAAFTRLYGNNWDQGQHLNPDERFLTMVATDMKWPKSFSAYLDTSSSTLNPHNLKFDFYVYGTWPIILIKFIAERLNMGDYGNLTLVGRAASGVVDLLTLFCIFLIGKRLSTIHSHKHKGYIVGLFCMAIYSFTGLPVQLSHYFTTDPYLTLFTTVIVYLLLFSPGYLTGIATGIATGFALSAKISGILIFPVIGFSSFLFIIPEIIGLVKNSYKINKDVKKQMWITLKRKSVQLFIFYSLFIVFFFLSFRLLMPYLFENSRLITFSLNPKVVDNWNTLQGFNNPKAWFPPAVQWINQPKIIFPFMNMIFLGLGIPVTLLAGIGVIWSLISWRKNYLILIPLVFSILIFIYQGIQFNMPLRYFWIMYPMLAVISGYWLYNFFQTTGRHIPQSLFIPFSFVYVVILFMWPISLVSIYSKTTTRVAASEWIYTHIPEATGITHEHWDDPLPLNLPDHPLSSIYTGIELPMFGEDTQQKWEEINQKINTATYIVLSSNRVYGSTVSLPERYKETAIFYKKLFSGDLGFKKVAEFTSRPRFPFPINLCISLPFFHYGSIDTEFSSALNTCQGLEIIDDYADETWTVYDHPKVTIFQRI